MSSNDHGTNNADFALDIENIGNDAQIGRDNNNVRGTNHDKVSQILSGWMPRRKTGNIAARSTGENGDGVLSAWGEEEQRSRGTGDRHAEAGTVDGTGGRGEDQG